MNFAEYQSQTKLTAEYPVVGQAFVYPALGLLGEAGEVAEKIKKIFRDDNQILTEERKQLLKEELGDVLWYVSQLATELGLDLEAVVEFNLEKLKSRQERGKISGDGDRR